MIRLDIDKIVKHIQYSVKHYIRWSDLEESLAEVVIKADWQDDGTGRAITADYHGYRWYIILDKPVLEYFNRLHDMTMLQTCHLRQDSKYGEDVLEFRVSFMELPLAK